MVDKHRKAIEKLWKDRCTITRKVSVTDPVTKLTDFKETTLVSDQPCKLSFETLAVADGDPAAAKAQRVKLFITPDLDIPAGCKVSVSRGDRTFTYASSGEPGVFTNHQEILLDLWKGWA